MDTKSDSVPRPSVPGQCIVNQGVASLRRLTEQRRDQFSADLQSCDLRRDWDETLASSGVRLTNNGGHLLFTGREQLKVWGMQKEWFRGMDPKINTVALPFFFF